MILLDKVLMGVMLIATGTALFLMYRLVREDPEYWFGGWRNRRFWVVMERLQPDENTALLRRSKKQEEDQRRE